MEPPKPEADTEPHVPNGDSAAAKGSGSESQDPKERTAPSSGSMKKSVHWSPELVTESTFTSSPQGSRFNSYFSSSSSSQSPSSSFSVMGQCSVVFYFLLIFNVYEFALHACGMDMCFLFFFLCNSFVGCDQRRW